MALVVQKFGGSSVAGPEMIRRVAEPVVETRRAGHDVVVVVSAMGDTTDDLLALAGLVAAEPEPRDLDVLLASGESVSSALLAMAVRALGFEACSLSGWQAGVVTTSDHGRARIAQVAPVRVRHELDRGAVVVVAGFQGLCADTQDVTTLGRGGSDTTAVALAVALEADVCEIYTDVDGVFTADPRSVPAARRLDHVGYPEMLALAGAGAKVLMLRCVEYARRHGLALHVRSSVLVEPGTVVLGGVVGSAQAGGVAGSAQAAGAAGSAQAGGVAGSAQAAGAADPTMEQVLITGVASDRSVTEIVVSGLPDSTASVARIFRAVADAGAVIGMVARNAGAADLVFTVSSDDASEVWAALHAGRADLGFEQVRLDQNVGTVSLIGAGIRSDPGVTATFCEALAEAGAGIEIMSSSELRLSALCRDHQVADAVRALHDAFGLRERRDAGRPAMAFAGFLDGDVPAGTDEPAGVGR